ncbi:hypothetical protein GCM10008110_15580 [Marinobacter persicus]|nr:hypothetical protein GCM10008110_15580 [Marinobacter persicus]
MVKQSRQNAPGDQLGKEAVQQFTYPIEATFSCQGELQTVQQERNTNENDDATDPVQDRSDGWQREMELAEIEIYWSFAIHSALTLSFGSAGPSMAADG